MKNIVKYSISAVMLFAVWSSISYIYRYFQAIEVVNYIKRDTGYLDAIILKNPPADSSKFIQWWQANRERIAKEHQIPSQSIEGRYSLSFWDIGDGYHSDQTGEDKPGFSILPFGDTYDMVCFKELKKVESCLDKSNRYADLDRSVSGAVQLKFLHDKPQVSYLETKDGSFIKRIE